MEKLSCEVKSRYKLAFPKDLLTQNDDFKIEGTLSF